MKCQILFSRKNKKNISLLSDDFCFNASIFVVYAAAFIEMVSG